LRYFVRRIFISFALLCSFVVLTQSRAQTPPATNDAKANAPTQQIAPELVDAEAAIVKSDWKAAAAKLDAYLTTHATDARALFDAGYVADHLDHLDAAAGFYRRALEVNPNSFEAHLALGLLLARQGKKDEAHTELLAATTLDPGEAGPAMKARAWRALARLDNPGPDG
jgi:tetratricopeptide (TPR) repeat protein